LKRDMQAGWKQANRDTVILIWDGSFNPSWSPV
jgi:hypothetical protein